RPTEDDQATALIAIASPVTGAGGGQTPVGRVASRKLRPRGLTVTVARTGRRLLVSGRLGLPPGARRRGRVMVTASVGKTTRTVRARLALVRGRCAYRASLGAPRGRRVTVTVRFPGNAELTAIARRAVARLGEPARGPRRSAPRSRR